MIRTMVTGGQIFLSEKLLRILSAKDYIKACDKTTPLLLSPFMSSTNFYFHTQIVPEST